MKQNEEKADLDIVELNNQSRGEDITITNGMIANLKPADFYNKLFYLKSNNLYNWRL